MTPVNLLEPVAFFDSTVKEAHTFRSKLHQSWERDTIRLSPAQISAGANTELIWVHPVAHGIKGKPLHLAVETHFSLEGVRFQGTWFQISPKHTHLVTFDNGSAIPNMLLKDVLEPITPPNISLSFKRLDEEAEGEYQLKINIFRPGQKEPLTVTKNVMITVNVPLSTPVILKSPKGALVEDQDNVTLTCFVENGTKAKYQWFKSNMLVSPSEHHMFSQNNGTLFINPVKQQDIGLYSCAVKNPISHARSKEVEISVFYGPYNLEVNSDQCRRIGGVFHVNQGELVFFECLADSNPPNTCVWISKNENGTEVMMTGPRFEVAAYNLGQATEFWCRAVNNITNKQDEAHFTLVVANLGKDKEKRIQEGSIVSPLAGIIVLSLLIIVCMLIVLFRKSCHPQKVLMKIYSRPIPEQKGLHPSGHEDATEDFGIYEFVSIPGRAESIQASCRSLARLDSTRDLNATIYDVIRQVPETPTLGLLK
ncbi:HEPACAM family member 2 [Trichomycterus rosablanca]|uniref:HEPACAM family member 2 n=1 Tax=Trichomycterus rosablanca TaxID=2290929 RepID=UPI002F35A106